MSDENRSASAEDPTRLIDDVQLAERWGTSPKTLRNQRVSGSPVPFVRIGRLVRYRLSDVLAYEASQTRRSTSERGTK